MALLYFLSDLFPAHQRTHQPQNVVSVTLLLYVLQVMWIYWDLMKIFLYNQKRGRLLFVSDLSVFTHFKIVPCPQVPTAKEVPTTYIIFCCMLLLTFCCVLCVQLVIFVLQRSWKMQQESWKNHRISSSEMAGDFYSIWYIR